MLSNEPEYGFDEDVGELLWGEARGLRDERLPFGFKGPVRLLEEREDNRILVRKVVVQATDRRITSSGDGRHGCGFEADFAKESGGDVENGSKGALGALLLRGSPDDLTELRFFRV
jgi:hypothetical protein